MFPDSVEDWVCLGYPELLNGQGRNQLMAVK